MESVIPVKSFSVAVHICRIKEGGMDVLLFQRDSGARKEEWEPLSAKLNWNELGWQSALREVRNYTGHPPDRMYCTDRVEQFYDQLHHCIRLVPVFVAFFDHGQQTSPMTPGISNSWVDYLEATVTMPFPHQRASLLTIFENYVLDHPKDYMKVYPTVH